MFEYKFVNAPVAYKNGGINAESYQTVITEHAAQGWRLVQIFVENPAAVPSAYVIIFERETKENER